eukprot:gnl/TRDRNA2_/TRDRNA2_184813_c0_seq1.p1 gnl/TRDRNA2_/TRDRNA2_184813_c0~~gnl/TRDRNA2_/TRDRNA2_184813_c0_seq1.p1  ORF type:complete len:268 (-),score=55.14 gnl/TRDRNA2_/TRDRNA2_184813_c0_seq1:92-895(-)
MGPLDPRPYADVNLARVGAHTRSAVALAHTRADMVAPGAADDDGPELPLPAMGIAEESLFDVTSETVDAKLLFLGLDNAGKTTLMQMLKNDRVVAQEPTVHPQSEELVIDKIRFKAFDLAGHETCRRLWKDYFASSGTSATAILFIVDACDRSRFPEAAEELSKLLQEACLVAVPLAVLANKADRSTAVSEAEFRSALELSPSKLSPPGRPVEIFMSSVTEKRGYGDAIRWLSKILLKQHSDGCFAAAPVPPKAESAAAQDDLDFDV